MAEHHKVLGLSVQNVSFKLISFPTLKQLKKITVPNICNFHCDNNIFLKTMISEMSGNAVSDTGMLNKSPELTHAIIMNYNM